MSEASSGGFQLPSQFCSIVPALVCEPPSMSMPFLDTQVSPTPEGPPLCELIIK